MHSLAAIPILSVMWALFGYSLAFGPTHHGLIGGLEFAGLDAGSRATSTARSRRWPSSPSR